MGHVATILQHFGSKCRRIRASMNTSRKRLKADLASGVRKLGSVPLASKLGEFPIFGSFFDFSSLDFPDLNDFWNLADFWPFAFPNFLAYSIPSPQFLLILSLPSFLLGTGLLSLFLVEANLLPSFLLGAGLLVIFNIEVSEAAILLKPRMNRL